LIPTPEALAMFPIETIGKKDVPPNVPFWIIDEEQLPVDDFMLDAMVIDSSVAGPPSGVGSQHETFEGVIGEQGEVVNV
jgi:hypothetical protein